MYHVIIAGGSGSRFWPKSRRDNPKQLLDVLTKKYGERFSDYRKQYSKAVNNHKYNYDYVSDYPLNVLVEVVNKCNLECIMCLSSHRKGPTRVISEETISKLFKEFKTQFLT